MCLILLVEPVRRFSWLAKHGYDVVGADINSKMLKIAINKAKQEKLPLKFIKGDMRNLEVGEFDAVITIFNAIGHLTRLDFEEAPLFDEELLRWLSMGQLRPFPPSA